MPTKQLLLVGFAALALAGCGTTGGGFTDNSDGSYTVAAQHGSLDGSWPRAERDATTLAYGLCARQQAVPVVAAVWRTGVYGFTPQRVELTFRCSRAAAQQAQGQPPPRSTADARAPRYGCSETGSCYGDISPTTGQPRTEYVQGYTRRDGRYVGSYYRSRGRR